MKINLEQIYKELQAWREERGITAKSQKDGYIVNAMKELGELAGALRDYEKFSKHDCPYCEIDKQIAEHRIIDALCDIAVFTINAGADINYNEKIKIIDTTKTTRKDSSLSFLLSECGDFDYYGEFMPDFFNDILIDCAKLCENYGFNFEIAMLETIKEISSRTGSFDESLNKWIKDTSDEARKKWYKANYDLARL